MAVFFLIFIKLSTDAQHLNIVHMKKTTSTPFQLFIESCSAAVKGSTHFLNQLIKRPAVLDHGPGDRILRGKILDRRHRSKNDIMF